MTTVNQRMQELIKTLKMNPSSFAKSIGKPHSTIANVTDGRSKPGFDILELILEKYPEINPLWFIRGIGEMFQPMTNVSADGGADVENELRDKIKMQNDTINDLRYTVELQKRLLNGGDLGKFEGDLFDRLPVGFPNFFGLSTGIVTGTPVRY
ncbi:helix-turn-helix transcriptional regulator [Siphonobacter sp. SORGH_AS_1065]|uniref:helix-turn-helix domain-containing protein n=1 Tax=Siphonobacter sp. SORGH_AS_1065 TaxID=3041795 RepID=UPI00277DC1F7|nr:helix-turn-helix transcriptional regulator [Siphonobacter sp. SORGH_AS_1065]MDQ1085679.1 hypothetical protein [Siphonobacter sp. SORGH_AS_1065]